MAFTSDFLDAYERHKHDAELLYQAQRWANADHLYGIAAECGLKYLMTVFGMAVDSSSGSPMDNRDKKHANGIWRRFESYRCGYSQGAGYALPPENPFKDWNVSDRYAHQSKFQQPRTEFHQIGVQIVTELIQKVRRDGLI
ncbi:MAG: SAM-dependent methyltransferase [Magnetococcales bacterium]|nr:SAM-dependent methyltransferase [Magnetococcales bacterium]